MKKLITFLFAFGSVFVIKGQGWYKNYEKYWWYRYRLVNDFMKIGLGNGESIPAYKRIRGDKYLDWGDATQALGHYLAMTATEYRILENNGWNTNRSFQENFFAIKAFERLDQNAESYCNDIHGTYPNNPSPSSSDLNGFFIRDDVADNFVTNNIQHFNRPGIINTNPVGNNSIQINVENYAWINIDGASSSYNNRALITPSDWSSMYFTQRNSLSPSPAVTGDAPQYPQEESQDQLSEIFVGLALSYYSVWPNAYYSMQNVYRSINWAGTGPNPWIIKNTLTNHCVYGVDGWKNYFAPGYGCSAGGAIMVTSAPAAAKGADMIAGSNYSTSGLLTTASGFEPAFQATQAFNSPEIMFQECYVAFSRNWEVGIPTPFGTISLTNTSWKTIRDHAMSHDWRTPHLPLIYKLNYPGGGVGYCHECHGGLSYEQLLDLSYPCGNFNYSSEVDQLWGDREWSSIDRLGFAFQRGDKNNCEFNNVDYMELFNLYSLVDGNYLKWIINPYYEDNFKVNYPDYNNNGSHSNKLKLNYLEYLGASNTVTNNGDVTYRGAKVIDLKKGFQVEYGGFFEAYVQDYSCSSENEYHYAELTTGEGENLHSAIIEYNPTNTLYQSEQERTNISNEYYSEDTAADYIVTDEIMSQYLDSLQIEMRNSENADLLFETYPYLFSSSKAERKTTVNVGNTSKPFFSVYPVPNNGIFTIQVYDIDEYDVIIYNLNGTEVFHQKILNKTEFDIILPNTVTSGLYLLAVTSRTFKGEKTITVIR